MERRTKERVETCLDVKWANRGGRVSDLSDGGCYVDSIGEVVVGEIVHLTFTLPDGRRFSLEGEVAHNTPRLGFGVRFINLTDEQRNMIRWLRGKSPACAERQRSLPFAGLEIDPSKFGRSL